MDPFDEDDVPDTELPVPMRETRFLAAPEGVAVYMPPEDASPNDLLIVKYHDFFAVVRELGGSPLQAFQLFSQKLMSAVVTNGEDVVRSMMPPPQPERPAMAVEFATRQDFEEYVNGEIDRAVEAAKVVAYRDGMAEGQRQAVALGTAKGSVESLDVSEKPGENDGATAADETTDGPSDGSSSPAQGKNRKG